MATRWTQIDPKTDALDRIAGLLKGLRGRAAVAYNLAIDTLAAEEPREPALETVDVNTIGKPLEGITEELQQLILSPYIGGQARMAVTRACACLFTAIEHNAKYYGAQPPHVHTAKTIALADASSYRAECEECHESLALCDCVNDTEGKGDSECTRCGGSGWITKPAEGAAV